MTITFVGNGPWGSGVGRPLTVPEHDGNIHDLDSRVADLEGTGADAITIAAEYTGGSITFLVNGGEEDGGYNLGPFALPVATINPVGPWLNNAEYSYLDLVDVPVLGQYLVLIPHTTPASPEEFDPDAVDEDDNPLYKLFNSFESSMKFRGEFTAVSYTIDDVFVHSTYGAFVVLQDHLAVEPFDALAEAGGEPLYKQIAGPPFSPPDTIITDTYEISRDDIGKYLRFTHVDGCEVSFVDDDFPEGIEIHFRQESDSPIYFMEAETNIILNPQRDGYETATPWKGATVTAKHIGSGEWDLIGPFGDELT